MPAPMIPQWRIQLRDHSLVPLGELTDYIDGDLILNFNDVGTWALSVRADSPMAANFAAGRGAIFSRDRGDGSGAQTLLSGPIWHLERRLKDHTYVLAGPSDEWWLKARRADPVTAAPDYATPTMALAGCLRHYKLDEPSGTTATDSKSAQNGTYTGGFTLNQAPGIDDLGKSVLFNGTTGFVSCPTTSIPIGNNPFTMRTWCYSTDASPSAIRATMSWSGPSMSPFLGLGSTGIPAFGNGAGSTLSPAGFGALKLAYWHQLVGTWDGTTRRLYVDGVEIGNDTPTAYVNASISAVSLGRHGSVAQWFWLGGLDACEIFSSALSAAQIAADYALGRSRYASKAYDVRTNTASTVIRGYVNDNAGPGAVSARQVFGLAMAADPAIGASVTGNARFDNLLALCQQLALSGGDIGFRLTQTDVGVLTFTIYQPVTQSNAIFSRELGNLLDAVYTLDGPTANQYVIGGGGEGVLRICVAGQDSTSATNWGLVEGFIDARDTSEIGTLTQRTSAQLAQDAQKTNLSITPTDTAALQFGRDYNLGDIVNVQIDGATITDKIRQLHIKLNDTDQELVTPGIGNAGAGQIAELFDARQRALASVSAQLAKLQTAQ